MGGVKTNKRLVWFGGVGMGEEKSDSWCVGTVRLASQSQGSPSPPPLLHSISQLLIFWANSPQKTRNKPPKHLDGHVDVAVLDAWKRS